MTEGEEGILWLFADAVKKARCEEGCLQTPPHYLKPLCFHGHHNGHSRGNARSRVRNYHGNYPARVMWCGSSGTEIQRDPTRSNEILSTQAWPWRIPDRSGRGDAASETESSES